MSNEDVTIEIEVEEPELDDEGFPVVARSKPEEDGLEYEADDLKIVQVVHDTITPKTIWDTREQWLPIAQNSVESWNEMTTEEQQATMDIIRRSLERAIDDLPEWLPESIVAKGGNFMDIYLRFIFTDVSDQIEKHKKATSRALNKSREDTETGLNEMDELESEFVTRRSGSSEE